ncbi:MAG TPA: hypothetical protein VFP84_21300 [Kofleriaceae bacterium]|nr:hypothetical protein [Kofleriaceae bacterium]
MAQIRIVDDWLRSPAAGPSHWRSVMVIAERWAEQRVLMRAYAESRDQLRPTIMLHGTELAIGPAGLDLNGPWGIHVGDNPEGRAQDIKDQLEVTARRLAGSKGNPPRLADEESRFETDPTANWAPGAPRMLPGRPAAGSSAPRVEHVAPIGAARVPQAQPAAFVSPAPAQAPSAPTNPEQRTTPIPRRRTPTRPAAAYTQHGHPSHQPHTYHAVPAPATSSSRTALGYTSGSGAQSAVVRLGLLPHVSARLGWLVDRIVPPDFHIDARERFVLNALGERALAARAIGQLLEIADPVAFMEDLTRKLEHYGVDLIQPGDPQGGEPTYRLRG